MMRIWNSRVGKFMLVFLFGLMLCGAVTSVYIKNLSKLERIQMEQLAMVKANKVSSVLTQLLYKTRILSAVIQQNKGQVENFKQIAATIVDDPSIRNVLLAPDGIVSYVYPEAGNEAVLGLNFFDNKDGNREAMLAKETGQLVLGGPFSLVQGGQALVGRLPVYASDTSKETFWGIVSVTLNYPQALDNAELEDLQRQGFAYEIWRVSPDSHERQTIAQSPWDSKKNANYIECPMEILNAKWYFRLSPIHSWYEFPEAWTFLLVGISLSGLVAFLVLHNFDLSMMKREFERLSMNDALTGVPNRRGGFQLLSELTEISQSPFILCYLDLNDFKKINDKYGHNIGDKVLKHFVKETLYYLDPKHHKLIRVGGDEFIIIFQNLSNQNQVNEILQNINGALKKHHAQVEDTKSLSVSYSWGCASFPADGHTVDELIAVADRRMYDVKKTICETEKNSEK